MRSFPKTGRNLWRFQEVFRKKQNRCSWQKLVSETGLNPVYLLAHAAVESAWGQSHYAVYRGNYFGIGAVDSNPDNAHYMSGIVEGAKWIDENFYQDGAISLSDMKANNYASSPYWEGQIAQIVRTSYSILAQLQELEEQENHSQNM